jgi:hypothetical protein
MKQGTFNLTVHGQVERALDCAAMMQWPNRLIAWLRRTRILAVLAAALAVWLLWSSFDDGGRQPSVVHMRPR